MLLMVASTTPLRDGPELKTEKGTSQNLEKN